MIPAGIKDWCDCLVGPLIKPIPLAMQFGRIIDAAFDQVADIHDHFGAQQVELGHCHLEDVLPLTAGKFAEDGEGELVFAIVETLILPGQSVVVEVMPELAG